MILNFLSFSYVNTPPKKRLKKEGTVYSSQGKISSYNTGKDKL